MDEGGGSNLRHFGFIRVSHLDLKPRALRPGHLEVRLGGDERQHVLCLCVCEGVAVMVVMVVKW